MTPPPEFPPAPYVDRPLAADGRARFGAAVLRLLGWRIVLAQPVPRRCVIIVYPHTSNWDFVIGLAVKWYLDLGFRFMAKDTLFVGPFGRLLERWGGIPVDRRRHHGVTAQLVERFAGESDFLLVITPEGTRSRTERWHSGFYHLARAADVPLGLAYIDYAVKEAGIGGYLALTGDVDADMARIAAFYAGKTGKRPANAGPVRLAPPG